jgi:hypothetical protein
MWALREPGKKRMSKIKQVNESAHRRRRKAYDYGVGSRHNIWSGYLSSEKKLSQLGGCVFVTQRKENMASQAPVT